MSPPGPMLRPAAATLFLAFVGTASPGASAGEFTFERGSSGRPEVALTFDGGSDAGDTEHILRVLEEKGVRSTFFLTGSFISRHPELARRIAAGGHEVGNHTWSHPHLTAWGAERRQRTLPSVDRSFLVGELDATARAWEDATGRPMAPLWRAPFGELNPALSGWAAEAGWIHVGWTRDERGSRSLDSLDWVSDRSSRLYLSSAAILERILGFGAGGDGLNGGIVLLHLCTRREDPAVARLAALVDALRERGYRLVPVGEMLAGGEAPALPIRDAYAFRAHP